MLTAEHAQLIFFICKIIIVLIFLSVLSLNVVVVEIILFSLKTCTFFLSFAQVQVQVDE